MLIALLFLWQSPGYSIDVCRWVSRSFTDLEQITPAIVRQMPDHKILELQNKMEAETDWIRVNLRGASRAVDYQKLNDKMTELLANDIRAERSADVMAFVDPVMTKCEYATFFLETAERLMTSGQRLLGKFNNSIIGEAANARDKQVASVLKRIAEIERKSPEPVSEEGLRNALDRLETLSAEQEMILGENLLAYERIRKFADDPRRTVKNPELLSDADIEFFQKLYERRLGHPNIKHLDVVGSERPTLERVLQRAEGSRLARLAQKANVLRQERATVGIRFLLRVGLDKSVQAVSPYIPVSKWIPLRQYMHDWACYTFHFQWFDDLFKYARPTEGVQTHYQTLKAAYAKEGMETMEAYFRLFETREYREPLIEHTEKTDPEFAAILKTARKTVLDNKWPDLPRGAENGLVSPPNLAAMLIAGMLVSGVTAGYNYFAADDDEALTPEELLRLQTVGMTQIDALMEKARAKDPAAINTVREILRYEERIAENPAVVDVQRVADAVNAAR
jgi:hypothetical protein